MKTVNIDTAKRLQSLGYDGECSRWYAADGTLKSTNLVDTDIPAPRIDDVAYFLREKHGILLKPIHSFLNCGGRWKVWVEDISQPGRLCVEGSSKHYASFDEAYEAALDKALKIIENRQNK